MNLFRCAAVSLGVFTALVSAHAGAKTFPAASRETQELMKGYFGNTLICKAEGIFECHNWFKPDGTFIQFSWDSRPNIMVHGVNLSGVAGVEGTWWVEGSPGKYQICRKNGPDAPTACEEGVVRKVGDTWSHPAHNNWPGEAFVLVEGHH